MYDTKKDRFRIHYFIVKDLFEDDKKLISYYFYRRSVLYGKNCVTGKK